MKLLKTTLVAAVLGGLLVNAQAQTQQKQQQDPFYNDFMKLQKDMDAMFVNFHQKYFNDDKFFTQTSINAKSDFKEEAKKYVINIDLPGFERSNIQVKTHDHVLSVKAQNDSSQQTKKEHFYERERYMGSVYRSFTLPKNANMDKLSTRYKSGVLTIDIPKKS